MMQVQATQRLRPEYCSHTSFLIIRVLFLQFFLQILFIFFLEVEAASGASVAPRSSCAWSEMPTGEGRALSAEAAASRSGRVYRRAPQGGDFRDTYTLLHFWATWCLPCLAELPQIETLVSRFKAKNLSVVVVSVDREWDEVDAYFKNWREGPRFLSLRDPSRCWASFLGTERFPETYLFAPGGKLLRHWIGAQRWQDDVTIRQIDGFLEANVTKN